MSADRNGPTTVSILVPVHQPRPKHLSACLASVLAQTCDQWELILVADGRQPDEVNSILVAACDDDHRVRLIRLGEGRGISGASQAALQSATGVFVALLDHDDTLAPGAVGSVVAELGRFDDVDVLYSDEDKLDADDGHRKMPFFKPVFSPERLRCQMYLGHLLVIRTELAHRVGGFRSAYDGAQDHDLALRATEQARRVTHIPRLLYHWRESPQSTALSPEAKSWTRDAGARAVNDHLIRTGFPAVAFPADQAPGVVRLDPRLTTRPPVSVVVPTAGTRRTIDGVDVRLVDGAVVTAAERTDYPDMELVVVLDAAAPDDLPASVAVACGKRRHRIVRDGQPFNFARACNLGSVHAVGDVLVFLNDDTEIVNGDNLDVIQHQAPTTPGTSGSSLVSCGQVIGVNNAGTVKLVVVPGDDGELTFDRQAAAANNFAVHHRHIRTLLTLFDNNAVQGTAMPPQAAGGGNQP